VALNPRPVDPDARIPEAVRRAAARADQFYQQPDTPVEGGQREGQGEGEEGKNVDSSRAPVDNRANGDTQVNRDEGHTVTDESLKKVATRRANTQRPKETEEQPAQEESEAAPNPQPQQQIPHNEDSWERKFNAMKGRWETTSQQLQQQNQQIANLQNVIASMQTQQSQPVQQEQSTQREVESTLTQEEREQYGDEFLNVVAKKANEIVGPLKRELEGKLKQLDQQLGNVGQHVDQTAKERMLSTLDQQIPTWREINNNPEFVSWLQLPDTYSGSIRHELLTAAFNRNNTARVAAFFNGFLAEEAATAPQGQTRPETASLGSDQDTQPSRPSLETLAAPGRAKSAAAHAPAEKPIFKRAQIAAFYTDVAAGKWAGREKQKEKLEAQIFEAQQDGRIRN
jgi:hypothetical protein